MTCKTVPKCSESSFHIPHRYANSAFGWDPPSKQQELFDPLSRFILCRKSEDSIDGSETPLAAYTMFRFDSEEGEDVAYWCATFLSPLALLSQCYLATSYRWPKPRETAAWVRRSCRNLALLEANGA